MRRAWLFLLPLIAALLVGSASPSQAAGPTWTVLSVNNHGCTAGGWQFGVRLSGADAGGYIVHTLVTSGGSVYMNEKAENLGNFEDVWFLWGTSSYGPIDGTWPLTPGHQVRAVFQVEKPLGNVVASWTTVIKTCDQATLLWNGPTAEDADGDLLSVYQDVCPTLPSSRPNGCPVWPRTLSLTPKYGPKRVVGTLAAPGHPTFAVGRTVTVWKVRPGPDLKVATRTTGGAGGFTVPVGKGRYYATTRGLLQPKYGQVYAKRSATVTVG